MSGFLIYLLKLNFILSVFFAFYYWVLRKETFYTCNRAYALTAAFISLVFPVAPGKQGHITVTYDPTNRIYAFNKTLTVYSNGSPSRIVLTIKGTASK